MPRAREQMGEACGTIVASRTAGESSLARGPEGSDRWDERAQPLKECGRIVRARVGDAVSVCGVGAAGYHRSFASRGWSATAIVAVHSHHRHSLVQKRPLAMTSPCRAGENQGMTPAKSSHCQRNHKASFFPSFTLSFHSLFRQYTSPAIALAVYT
jgi:hypothetical protein